MASKKAPPIPARRELPYGKASLMSAELTPDGRSVLLAGFSGVYLIDEATGAEGLRYRPKQGNIVWTAQMTPDGSRVVAGNGSLMLQIWDARTAALLFDLPSEAIVTRLSISRDGKRAVTAAGNNRLRLWDLENGVPLGGLVTKKSFVIAAALSPDGDVAMHGGTDGNVRLFDCVNEQPITMTMGKGWIEVIERSSDGRFFVSAGRDKTVMIWSAKWEPVRTLHGATRTISSVTISPDGSRVVATGGGSPVVWDATDGKVLGKLVGEKVAYVRFSHDGRSIVSLDHTGFVRIHDTP